MGVMGFVNAFARARILCLKRAPEQAPVSPYEDHMPQTEATHLDFSSLIATSCKNAQDASGLIALEDVLSLSCNVYE